MAEEIDLEKCDLHNFTSTMTLTLTLIGSRPYLCAYVVEIYPYTKLDQNQKNFLWTYGRTNTTSNSRSIGKLPRRWPKNQ